MLAVEGIVLMCGGLVIFYVMLRLHRGVGPARWYDGRAMGELTVFTSMLVSLYGIAMLGQFGVDGGAASFGLMETGIIIAVILGTAGAIWKLYLPPPAPKSA